MPSYIVPAFPINNFVVVDVVDYQEDGVTPDLTEPLAVAVVNPVIASAVIDPTNPRKVKITGLAVGSTTVTVGAPGVPANQALGISITVLAPPNLSKVEAAGHTGPFPV